MQWAWALNFSKARVPHRGHLLILESVDIFFHSCFDESFSTTPHLFKVQDGPRDVGTEGKQSNRLNNRQKPRVFMKLENFKNFERKKTELNDCGDLSDFKKIARLQDF